MSWVLPMPLMLFAAAVAAGLILALVRRPTSPFRLVAEVIGTMLAAVAVAWIGWIALWLVEQRW